MLPFAITCRVEWKLKLFINLDVGVIETRLQQYLNKSIYKNTQY